MRSEGNAFPVHAVSPVNAYLNVVRFCAGGFFFAVEANQVKALCAGKPAKESGISANLLEDLIGLRAGETQYCKWLNIGRGGKDIFVGVSDPVRLDVFQASAIFPLPVMAAARISVSGIRAIALDQGGPVFLLDLQAICEEIDHHK